MNQRDHPLEGDTQSAPSPVEGAASLTLGAILRQARERQALTLDEVARRTRIPRHHLEALERNSLAGLPPGMYQRAEVRTYADAIGLDPQLALVALGRAQAAPPPAADTRPRQSVSRPPRRTRRRAHRARLALITVALLAVPIGAASWLWRWQPAAPVGLPQPAVDDQVGPTSPRPGTVANPRIGGNDAATPTPLPSGNESSPKVFEYPELRVITEPAGARVTVDGVGWGQSPLTIRALPPGARLVRVTLDGYAAEERHVGVSGDTPRTTVRITLRPLR